MRRQQAGEAVCTYLSKWGICLGPGIFSSHQHKDLAVTDMLCQRWRPRKEKMSSPVRCCFCFTASSSVQTTRVYSAAGLTHSVFCLWDPSVHILLICSFSLLYVCLLYFIHSSIGRYLSNFSSICLLWILLLWLYLRMSFGNYIYMLLLGEKFLDHSIGICLCLVNYNLNFQQKCLRVLGTPYPY